MIPVTLASGAPLERENLIAGAIDPSGTSVVILEGLPTASSALDDLAAAAQDRLQLIRVAAGCICCTGNLVMRVTLNRVLRQRPQHIYIGIADPGHVDGVKNFLSSPPYAALVHLDKHLSG